MIFAFALPNFSYLYWRLASSQLEAALLFLPFLLLATFPMKKIHRYHRQLIYLSLGAITYLTLSALLRDAVYLVSGYLFPSSVAIGLSFVLILVGYVLAYLGPHIKHVRLPIENLHPDLEGLKIAQISDLHIGPTIRKKYVLKVVAKTNRLSPDLIALTGDIGDGPVKVYREDLAPLSKLRARYGCFFVTGNHEYYWNGNDWLNVMNNIGMIVLMNRGKLLHVKGAKVFIGGVPDPVSKILPEIDIMAESGKESDFKILLSHRPGVARQAQAAGFQLQLSGHTHGGQFFPWTLVVRFVHEFHRGLAKIGNMWVYVNTGTGSWGPFLRLGSSTEITLVELYHSSGDLKSAGSRFMVE